MHHLKFFQFFMATVLFAVGAGQADTVISKVRGEVKIRRGLEESWVDAHVGDRLRELDTVLSQEGMVIFEMQDGSTFKLDSHSILDISDLRRISRQEMFLFIMSEKVKKMPSRKSSVLRSENFSSVHGEKQSLQKNAPKERATPEWQMQLNAARAMYEQRLYPNAVVKLHKILDHISKRVDCGGVSLYLGKSFEALDEPGQALDSYQQALDIARQCRDEHIAGEAATAIRRLSH